MTSEQLTLVLEGSRLVRLALNPRETVARNADYQQLIQRYHSEPEFRDITRNIASGLELEVVELAREVGLTVVNQSGGPYAPTLNDFKANMKLTERVATSRPFRPLSSSRLMAAISSRNSPTSKWRAPFMSKKLRIRDWLLNSQPRSRSLKGNPPATRPLMHRLIAQW